MKKGLAHVNTLGLDRDRDAQAPREPASRYAVEYSTASTSLAVNG